MKPLFVWRVNSSWPILAYFTLKALKWTAACFRNNNMKEQKQKVHSYSDLAWGSALLMCYHNICLQSDWKSSVFTGPPSLLPQGISCFVVVRSFPSPLTRCCNALEITRAETHFSMSASHKRLTRGCVAPGRRKLWLITLDWSQTERVMKVSSYRKKTHVLLLDLVCRKKACVLLCYEMSQQLDSCANITVCISCMPCFILYTVPGMS